MDDLISKTLNQSGANHQQAHGALAAMLKRELTPDMELPPMEFLMRLFGEPCFPRRELVAITGRAKSGKTFVMSIIMLMCLIKQALRFERDGDEPLKVMWFDTEQSDQSTLDIIQNRIMEMFYRKMGPDIPFPKENLRAFNVRFETCETRRKGFQALVPYVKPDLVILDGIRDLVPDINDGAEAQRIIEEMLSLAQANNLSSKMLKKKASFLNVKDMVETKTKPSANSGTSTPSPDPGTSSGSEGTGSDTGDGSGSEGGDDNGGNVGSGGFETGN